MAPARYKDFKWDVTFFSALAGLASALSKTHRLHLNQADHGVRLRGYRVPSRSPAAEHLGQPRHPSSSPTSGWVA